jgi:hypothetical protein
MHVVAACIVYGNLATVFQPSKLGLRGWPGLPAPMALLDAFLMTGMFSDYTRFNSAFVVTGQLIHGPERGHWIALDVKEHFPQRTGITYTQLWAAHHWDVHGQRAQREAWALLARKIRARHNRLHPEHAVSRLRLGALRWPISPQGYWTAKQPQHTRAQVWFEEPPS